MSTDTLKSTAAPAVATTAAPAVSHAPASEEGWPDLKAEYIKAVGLLLTGQTHIAIAEACGCSRSTLARWRKEPVFAAYYQSRVAELHDALQRQLQFLALQSGQNLMAAQSAFLNLLSDPAATPYVRHNAANSLLKGAHKWMEALVPIPAPQAFRLPTPVAQAGSLRAPAPPSAAAAPSKPMESAPSEGPDATRRQDAGATTDRGKEPVSGKRQSQAVSSAAAAPVPLSVNGEGLGVGSPRAEKPPSVITP